MELEDKPAQEIDLQTAPMLHTHTDMYNTLENSNIKQEPDFYGNAESAKFSEHAQCSGNVPNIIDIKTEAIDSGGYHCGNLNNTHGPTYSDRIVGHHIPGTIVNAIKPESEAETNVTNEFVIEIDTCKDEYYGQYGYPPSSVTVNLPNDELQGGRTLRGNNIRPCVVTLRDIKHMYPHIITRCSVQMHGPVPATVIDGPPQAATGTLARHTASNKTHVCQVCGAAFQCKSNLNSHRLIHTALKAHKCLVCGFESTWKGNMKTHMLIHTGDKPHKCSLCNVSFIMKAHLTNHIRRHTYEKPYICPVCGVGFTRAWNLKTHVAIHTGEKPHRCSLCEVSFTEKGSLTRHMRTHTGEKPYKCTICGDGFSQASHLQRHTTKHTGEKSHLCSVCGGGFTQKSHLKIHARIHTGEKPHKCPVCNSSFAQKCSLTRHMSTHTGEKP